MISKSQSQPKKPSYRNHNGFLMPMGFPVEGFASAISYQARSDDIFIATYPKCGTTWTMYIVWLLCHDGQPMTASQKIDDEIPHLEEVGKERIALLPVPRVIKTHLPYSLTPYHPAAKYIYVARNPFDCLVSFYHHTRGFIKHYDFADGTFNDYFECFLAGKVDFGDYFDNLLSWYVHKEDKNILFLTYEQMKANPEEAITQIAHFLGTSFSEKLSNKEIFQRVLYYSSFEKMSQNQERWSSQRPETMPSFIRRGQIGDWKNYFSPLQVKRLTEKFKRCTQGTDLETLWAGIIPA